jgi:hypothetical protein
MEEGAAVLCRQEGEVWGWKTSWRKVFSREGECGINSLMSQNLSKRMRTEKHTIGFGEK